MRKDGKSTFFRQLNLDKKVKRLISAFVEIKEKMLKEDIDAYSNGKISKTE